MDLKITLSLKHDYPYSDSPSMYISAPYEKLGPLFWEIKYDIDVDTFREAIDQIVAGTWSEPLVFDWTSGVTTVFVYPEISYYEEFDKDAGEIPTLQLFYLFNIWENFLKVSSAIIPIKM
ncbi:hypothetical protein P1X15_01405 [Runella sp. MFBS21]|uniref:hypothetical protein n=1 Tax=Runella sp. MFBS21 TaxID=3034018 RepID=UPI0023F9B700|nr:hypothetical protein [Runella sp. MFBS21]MDF7816221.1 hypothetical protein [Runella sp. MFBS21]